MQTRNLHARVGLIRIMIVDMPPLTSPDKPLSPACWRLLLLTACVLVFTFALHAKVVVYHQSTQPQTSTSTKLWVSVEKMASQPPSVSGSALWLAAFIVWLLSPRPELRLAVVDRTPGIVRARQLYLHRFLRPPPVR
jgi:hypothetical protein